MLSQEELDKLVGKTGQELLDTGWSDGYGYNLEEMEFWLDYGPFSYAVVFDDPVPESEYETFDTETGIKDRHVVSAKFFMLGNGATDIEIE